MSSVFLPSSFFDIVFLLKDPQKKKKKYEHVYVTPNIDYYENILINQVKSKKRKKEIGPKHNKANYHIFSYMHNSFPFVPFYCCCMLLLELTLLFPFPRALLEAPPISGGRVPPMIDEMAAASTAVKLGSEAMAAVAALKVSENAAFWLLGSTWLEEDVYNPENLDGWWLLPLLNKAWPNNCGS